jgi:hypothetical protein
MQDDYNFEPENNAENQIEEIGFADRVVGIFTAPVQTLDSISKMPQKASLWLIPLIIMIIVASLSTILYNYNPTLRAELESIQMESLEKNMQEQVEKGNISKEEADQQTANMTQQINSFGTMKLVLQIVSIVFVTFIFFFIVNGFFYLIMKFGFSGEGNYNSAMIAYSSVYYIMILQALLTMVLSLATGKFFIGLSLGNLFDFEMLSLQGFIFRKLDPFFVWFYILLGISYAKMFKSSNYIKYIALTLLSWIVVNALMYYLSTLSPIFQGFAM